MPASCKENFVKDGFVVVKQLFTPEEAEELKHEASAIMSKHGVEEDNSIGVFLGFVSESSLFKEAAAKSALVDVLKEVVGDYVIFLNDKMVFKNASTDYGSPWHQDHPYWNGSHKYSVWIALDDATKENGCLRVIPGSHLTGIILHDGEATDGKGFANRLNEAAIDETKIVDLQVSRGDAVVFHDLLIHASYPNKSGADRWALISTYKDGTQEDPEYPWANAAFTVCS